MKKILVLAILSLFVLIACGQADTTSTKLTEDNPVKIGVSLPLSGEAASIGAGVVSGIKLAVKEVNAAGGINGRPLQIIYEDDKCSRDGVTTVTKLVTADNVDALIGPLCSSAAGPGLPIAQQNGVPTIFYGSAPHLTSLGDYLFRIYPSDSFAGKFLAEYVINNMQKKKVAIVYVKNDWGQGIHDTFKARFEELGGTIVFDESLAQEESDARTVVTKLKASGAEIIVAPMYPAVGLVFVKQVRELGIDLPIIGGDAFEAEEFFGKKETEGVMFIAGRFNSPEEFVQKLKQEVPDGTINTLTPLGYDAVNLFVQVMKDVGTDKTAVRNALARTKFAGVSSSVIEFDEIGDLKSANYDVKVAKDGHWVLAEE
ncbi:hypothetical protein COV18_04120 [Candidatus Woesearchaeota archaeon CG10_big_fil_rev_8_21_14_0_10_37_12]|nr:MAG: hypothetical protein COV18_04120 [Candidatus Woesearchaeota archaeon CG10_big_fil_rev_8_21_14_0_10_37_12]